MKIRSDDPLLLFGGNDFEKDRLRARGKEETKMLNFTKIGAALMAIIVLALMPAAALATTTSHAHSAHGSPLGFLIALGLGIAGTVTVTYSSFAADNPTPQFGTPYTGGTTAPSALQSSQVTRINALVGFTDADLTITLTHNWNLSAAAQAANQPDIVIRGSAVGNSNTFGQAEITWTVGTNSVTGTKASIAGSGGTACVTLLIPGVN
jgi:hypothetical protein